MFRITFSYYVVNKIINIHALSEVDGKTINGVILKWNDIPNAKSNMLTLQETGQTVLRCIIGSFLEGSPSCVDEPFGNAYGHCVDSPLGTPMGTVFIAPWARLWHFNKRSTFLFRALFLWALNWFISLHEYFFVIWATRERTTSGPPPHSENPVSQ